MYEIQFNDVENFHIFQQFIKLILFQFKSIKGNNVSLASEVNYFYFADFFF